MWFRRMTLEEWFDDYQYEIKYDIGESAVKYLTVEDLGLDLGNVALRYGFHRGRPDLRECLAEQYPGLSGEHVLVTSGCSEAIFAAVLALVEPGDHVIVEHPNYPSLYEVPRSLNCDVSFLELTFDRHFKPSLDELQDMITPRTKLVSLTHPNNPTGSTITQDELDALVELVESRGLYLLFDETYREMDFADSLQPAASLSPRAISVSSMSKCYGLPGIRIGWIATRDTRLLDAILAVREQVTIANSAVGEVVALHALQRKDELLEKAKAHIARNRDVVARWIDGQDWLEWIYPEAGVVCLPRIRAHVPVNPEQLYRRLAEKYKTFVIPGRCFEMDNRHFRLGFGANAEEIRVGLANLERALDDLKP